MTTLTEYREAAEQLKRWHRVLVLDEKDPSKWAWRTPEMKAAWEAINALAEGNVLAPLDDLKRLVFAARTTGGTSGRDDELCDACAAIEPLLIAAATQGENS